jgi:hypothetical protein
VKEKERKKVKTKRRLLALPLLSLVAFGLLGLACAGTANTASVWTTDSNNVTKNQFLATDTILIWWHVNPPGTTVDIKVVDSANNVVAGPFLNQVTSSQPITIGPLPQGYYTVFANGQPQFDIATATFFVVPESIFGGLAALGAGFAAFGLVKMKKIIPKF